MKTKQLAFLLFIAMILLAMAGIAQPPEIKGPYGYEDLSVSGRLGIPNDTTHAKKAWQTSLPDIVVINDSILMVWSVVLQRYVLPKSSSSSSVGWSDIVGSDPMVNSPLAALFNAKQNTLPTGTSSDYIGGDHFLHNLDSFLTAHNWVNKSDTVFTHIQSGSVDSLVFANGIYREVNNVYAHYEWPIWNANRIQSFFVEANAHPGNGWFMMMDSINGVIKWARPDSVVGTYSTPTLQQVTDAGNFTKNYIFGITDFSGDAVAVLQRVGSQGEVYVGDSTATPWLRMKPFGFTNDYNHNFKIPIGSGTDTLATLADVRSGGGLSGTVGANEIAFGDGSGGLTSSAQMKYELGDFHLWGLNWSELGVQVGYHSFTGLSADSLQWDMAPYLNTSEGLTHHDLQFSAYNDYNGSGSIQKAVMRLKRNGTVMLNDYGLGTHTGTAAYSLSVDASGNVIETTAGGGSTPTLGQVLTAGATTSLSAYFTSGGNTTSVSGGLIDISGGLYSADISPTAIYVTDGNNSINLKNDHIKFVGNGNSDAIRLYGITPATGIDTLYLPDNGGKKDTLATQAWVRANAGGGSIPGIDDVLAAGSTLSTTRTIAAGANVLNVTGSSTSVLNVTSSSGVGANAAIAAAGGNAIGLSASSSTSTGVNASTTNGTAISASASASAGLPMSVSANQSSTNSVFELMELSRTTTGTAAVGLGAKVTWFLEMSNGSNIESNSLQSIWQNATNGSQTSQFKITGVNAGSTVDVWTMNGDGSVQLRGITGTAASAITPSAGMIVFVTSTNGSFTSVGFWGYDGTSWSKF